MTSTVFATFGTKLKGDGFSGKIREACHLILMAKSNTSNKSNKMESLNKGKAGRIVLVRVLIIVLVDVIVATLFDFINSEAQREYDFHFIFKTPLTYIFAALLVVGIVFVALTKMKKIDTSAWVMTPVMASVVSLYLFVTTLFFDNFVTTPFLFYTMTVVVSVLFAIYYIYTILLYKK